MTHAHALSGRREPDASDPRPGCTGELAFDRPSFLDDVNWSMYTCRDCGARIAMVGGGTHHWNHVRPVAVPIAD